MSVGDAATLMRGSILEILILSAPLLIVGMVVGLIISVIQATTSIQEQTLTFVPKIAAIFLILIIFGPWMFSHIATYTRALFDLIPGMAG